MHKNLIIFILILTIVLTGCTLSEPDSAQQTRINNLMIHFLDVGQADSIFIQDPSGNTMLIDAGNNADSELITNYIHNLGIKKIDFLIGTHPHEDHIGGMDAVINEFDIGTIYMPKVSNNTRTFEDVLIAIRDKGYKIKAPTPGSEFSLGNSLCTILSPIDSTYDEINNYSIVLRLSYGDTSFLFQGDAEGLVESEILSKYADIHADLIKLGHHGSKFSSNDDYLKAVDPKFAVISSGKDNSYGHPHKETLDILNEMGIDTYRTDQLGTIIVTSNGTNITLNKNASTIQANAPPATINKDTETTVFVTQKGNKYHVDGCRYLDEDKTLIYLEEAQLEGYEPCKVCKPPK